MLFKIENGAPVRMTESELREWKDKVLAKHPSIGQGSVQISCLPKFLDKVSRFLRGGVTPVKSTFNATPTKMISTTGFYYEGGMKRVVRYSEVFPIQENNKWLWPGDDEVIPLEGTNTFSWNEGNDDKLLFLLCFSSRVEGSVRTDEEMDPVFKLVVPAAEAQLQADNLIESSRLVSRYLNPETAISYDCVKHVMEKSLMTLSGNESIDRQNLYKAISGKTKEHADMRVKIERMVEGYLSSNGRSKDNADLSAINKTVALALQDNVLVKDNGEWVCQNKNGGARVTITKVKGKDLNEEKMNLLQHLSGDPKMVEMLNSRNEQAFIPEAGEGANVFEPDAKGGDEGVTV